MNLPAPLYHGLPILRGCSLLTMQADATELCSFVSIWVKLGMNLQQLLWQSKGALYLHNSGRELAIELERSTNHFEQSPSNAIWLPLLLALFITAMPHPI